LRKMFPDHHLRPPQQIKDGAPYRESLKPRF